MYTYKMSLTENSLKVKLLEKQNSFSYSLRPDAEILMPKTDVVCS